MAAEKKLDCLILGLLSHENLTGYEIKKRIDTTLRYFWGASYGSIYPTLNALVGQGFATSHPLPESKRGKIVYTITDEGKAYLGTWLSLPAERDEIRYETLLKLFFSGDAGPETALEHIVHFEEKIRSELPYLLLSVEQLEGILDMAEAHRYYLLTAKFGVETYRAYLAWCEEAKATLGHVLDGSATK